MTPAKQGKGEKNNEDPLEALKFDPNSCDERNYFRKLRASRNESPLPGNFPNDPTQEGRTIGPPYEVALIWKEQRNELEEQGPVAWEDEPAVAWMTKWQVEKTKEEEKAIKA